MLFQKQNNPPKMFSKLNSQINMFNKQTSSQTVRPHNPNHNQSNENKYKNHLEISK